MSARLPAALQVSLGHATQQGLRPRNEDYVGATTPEGETLAGKGMLLAVADGLGGHANGREAAEYCVRGLLADYYATPDTWSIEQSVDTVVGALNRWLLAQSARSRDHAGMATTLTGLVLRGRRYHVLHVGDSRAYLWRDGTLRQLTEDHTWEHPEFNNVLRRAVGLDAQLLIDHDNGELQAGDTFLLLTDGVWNALNDAALADLLARHTDPQQAAEVLTLEALRRGATDNCTALVATVLALPPDNLRDRVADQRKLPLPPRLAIGQEIDGLRVEEVLHDSRVTLLYRVSDPASRQLRVLKTLIPEAGDDEARAALVREEWLARRVPGKGFPHVIDHPGRTHLYYLMSWH
ncbi:MAG TPA: PP2C family serine/threonine-protein phosphatase, partial [Rhodocyclaceae bacterium]|nr:PP2C family serine/threonine-protein phosphatase [Rhodocyclaceae bacterium]